MKDVLTGELRRAKDSVFSMMNSACDAKRLETDNVVSIMQVMSIFLKLLEKKHVIDHAEVKHLYSFSQGELDEF